MSLPMKLQCDNKAATFPVIQFNVTEQSMLKWTHISLKRRFKDENVCILFVPTTVQVIDISLLLIPLSTN